MYVGKEEVLENSEYLNLSVNASLPNYLNTRQTLVFYRMMFPDQLCPKFFSYHTISSAIVIFKRHLGVKSGFLTSCYFLYRLSNNSLTKHYEMCTLTFQIPSIITEHSPFSKLIYNSNQTKKTTWNNWWNNRLYSQSG